MLALNDEKTWLLNTDYIEPESAESLASVQTQVDSILGVGRDKKSIAKVVWNGDAKFWKEIFIDWDITGEPTVLIRRPHLLYKTIVDSKDNFVRDVFVPRYIVLTRIEPEQYVMTWEKDTKIYCPERKRKISYRPTTPPADYYLWHATIAHHNGHCCAVADKEGAACFGQYAPPSKFIQDARDIRQGMDFMKLPKNSPFDSPDAVSRRTRERMTNNYDEQAMRKFNQRVSYLIENDPFVALTDETIAKGASFRDVQNEARENLKRQQDAFEKKLKKLNNLQKQGAIK